MKTYRIEQDTDCVNPREWDNLGTMAFFHRRYTLGDSGNFPMEPPKDSIWLPVFMYDHSGLTIRTYPFECRWDSGKLGYIFASKEKVRKETGWQRITAKRKARIESYLISEVETYNKWLNGDCWGYVIDENGEEIDSCWGFIGYDYCESEAKQNLNYENK